MTAEAALIGKITITQHNAAGQIRAGRFDAAQLQRPAILC